MSPLSQRAAQAGTGILDWVFTNWYVILILVLFVLWMNSTADAEAQKLIAKLEGRSAAAAERNAQLEDLLQDAVDKQKALQGEIDAANKDVQRLRAENERQLEEIAQLEVARQEMELTTRGINTEDDLERRFGEVYKEVTFDSQFGIMDIEVNGIVTPYMIIPAWYTKVFLVEHDNLEIANQKVGLYDEVVERFGTLEEIHDRIAILEREKFDLEQQAKVAATEAYRTCYAEQREERKEFLEWAQRPRFELPGGAKMLGCAALGAGAFIGISKALD